MNFAPNYLVGRLIYRFIDFFHHWYIDGSRNFFHWLTNYLEQLDRSLAFRVTLKHFFQPLYGDYTIVGRILGIIFRILRLAIGLVVYVFILFFSLSSYLIWLLIPILIIAYAFSAA